MTISVIIPVFNAANYIGEALRSILEQTHPVNEVIVINDGSTDNLAGALKPFINSITLLDQVNSGQAAARNRGVKFVKTELIAFLDADDYWVNNHIEILHNRLSNDASLDYAIGSVKNFSHGQVASDISIDHADALAGFVPGAGLFRRSCFEKVGLFDESYRLAEVVDWSSRALDSSLNFEISREVTLMRRIHGGNIGIKKKEQQSEYLRAIRNSLSRRKLKK